MSTQSAPAAALETIAAAARPDAVIPREDATPFLEEWRGRWTGVTPLILAPKTTEDLSQIMAAAHGAGWPIVPQGGNTGLVGGQIPDGEVLISTKRLRSTLTVSPGDFTLTASAGFTLAEVQMAAAEADRLFPLSIGSEGTCQIGGILSTNAGGVAVLRYGNARDLCLGIEAVLPDGRIWNGLNHLRKNNTGYDMKHLFIGGEGTLGIITSAVLKLYSRPKETLTAFLALPHANAAVDLLSFAQEHSGEGVTSFELLNRDTYELVLHHFSDLPRPVETDAPYYVLIEFSAGRQGTLGPLAEDLLEGALEREWVIDGTIAQSTQQAEDLWHLRHNATEAMKKDPTYCVKCDVSVPIRAVPSFLDAAANVVEAETPGARIIAFGHMGDGNIHFDILGPVGADDTDWRARAATLERRVHDVVVDHEGSISAEHGIGQLKRDELAERKPDVELSLMAAIKDAFDPKGLMNPGKLLKTR